MIKIKLGIVLGIFLLLMSSLYFNTSIQGSDTQTRFEAWNTTTPYDGSCGPSGGCHGGGSAIVGSGSITISGSNSVLPGSTFTLDISVSGFTQASNGQISFGIRNQDQDNSQFMGATSSFFDRRHALDGSGNSVSIFTTPSFTAPNTPGSYTIEALAINWDGNSVHYYLTGQKTITVISQPPVITSPTDISYEHGSTSNSISWTGTDDNPNTYNVYRNGSSVNTGSWTSGTPININVDGQEVGIHNYTMFLEDLNSNTVTDLVWVTVQDTTAPVITNPSDITYEHGSTSNSISWTGTENNPDTYTIYRDGSVADSGSWSSGSPITINIDGLALGTYNYTIIIMDTTGSFVTDLVWVTVQDTTAPVITNPSDITYEHGSTSNSITWTGTENNPDTYTIYRDGSVADSGSWSSGSPITINIDGLALGTYNYTIIIMDTTGSPVTDLVWATVQDTTAPVITNPSDIQYTEGALGNSISWIGTDNNPDMYTIYRDGSVVDSGSWSSGVPIGISADGLSLGVYNYTIIINDTSSNVISDLVWITVLDVVNPGISSPADIIYEFGTSSNSISWSASDSYPDTYVIYRNGTQIDSGSWTTGTPITISIDGLTTRLYNFTIVIFDTSNNNNSDLVWVTVQDTIAPIITSPSDIMYEFGSNGNNISWTGTDNNPANYIIYKDGITATSGTWSSGTPIVIDIDGLSLGTYNYTIIVWDNSTNEKIDLVWVTVEDTTNPNISTPTDIIYEFANTGNNITWTATDDFPDNYSIYRNDSPVDTNSWSSGSPIVINIDGLPLGTYNYTIMVIDSSGNSKTDLIWVTVEDTVIPAISNPGDIIYEQGSVNNNITWTANDDFPDNYTIYHDDSPVDTNSWSSGSPIVINIDGSTLGTYNYTIVVVDSSGNSKTDLVWVTVVDTTNPTISSPSDVSYEAGVIGNSLSWTAIDNNPSIYIIYNEGVPADSGSWSSGTPIIINVDGLSVGSYNFTISVIDSSNNPISDEVTVIVTTDIVLPLINQPSDISYPFGTTGNQISWTAIDNNPDSYLIYRNTTLIGSGSWTNATPIIHSIDGLSFGAYNYTIVVNDTFSNFFTDQVWVTVDDDTLVPIIINPGNITYQLATTGHSISWTVTDDNSNNYFIYKDDIIVDSGSWTSITPISISVDGLGLGSYNYTLLANDTFNNIITDTVWIFVVDDSIGPIITSPNDITNEYGSSGTNISWTGTDLNPTTYTIYRNGSIIDSGSWNSGIPLLINIPSNLTVGLYNYTILIADVGANTINDLVWVTVQDTTNPIVSNPNDFSYEYGSTGNNISWTATDLNPGIYFIYREGIQVDTGSWLDSVPVIISVDGLTTGSYNFTILILDNFSNPGIDTAFITVSDTTAPNVSNPSDINYEYGTTNNNISWIATDNFAQNYVIYREGSIVDSGSWAFGIPIITNIDGLSLGTYNYTLIVFDSSGNDFSDLVWVTVEDKTLPSISHPTDITFEQGVTGSNITWTGSDDFALNYDIYREGSIVDSGSWASGIPIIIDIDGLTVGIYNFTIIINDSSSNRASDLMWVTVEDTTPPVINSPSDFNYEFGSNGNNINWIVTDLNPDTYNIFRNGISVSSGSWTSGIPILIDIDGLGVNTYNYTIVTLDISGNNVTDLVWVTVSDTGSPSLTNPNDFSYEHQSNGNTISWTATDSNPNTFLIYRNGVQISSGFWSSGTPITTAIDGLPLGTYNFTILVTDTFSNAISDLVWVTVIDTASPIINSPNDLTYEFGTFSNSISWIGTDNNPGSYILYRNQLQITNNSWFSGIPISISVDGLILGLYNYTIIIFDSSGNNISDLIWVTVEDTTNPSITSPTDISYEQGATGNSLSWTASDYLPANYVVYRNNLQIETGVWASGTPININIDNLATGTYNLTIVITDTSGNNDSDLVWLNVEDTTSPNANTPADINYENGDTGNSISWIATDLNPNNYSVFRNGIPVNSGAWTSGIPIIIDVDNLAVNTYNFTIIISDLFGNNFSDSVIVIVVDTTDPVVTNPSNYTYEHGSSGNIASWTANDLNPDNYLIYENTIQIDSGTWISAVPITRNIDSLGVGLYNYTIIIYDLFGNFIIDTVWITVEDTTNPSTDTPSDVNYELGVIGNSIIWTATDNNPQNYFIYQNSIQVDAGTWVSGLPISIDIDNLALGTYNYSVLFLDTSSNPTLDTVWVTVLDTSAPIVNSPQDGLIEFGSKNNNITWIASDLTPTLYSVFRNGTVIITDNWLSNNPVVIDIDNLGLGTYNYSIVFWDLENNLGLDIVWITVVDTISPSIDNPGDTTIEYGSTGNTILWNASDLDPDIYKIYQDSIKIAETPWNVGTLISLTIDGLDIGNHNFTIVLFDVAGNKINDEVWITVIDTTRPTAIYTGNNPFEEGSIGNYISWILEDLNPFNYTIQIDEIVVDSGTWISGETISLSADYLASGLHEVIINVQDLYNNVYSSYLNVYVIPIDSSSTTSGSADSSISTSTSTIVSSTPSSKTKSTDSLTTSFSSANSPGFEIFAVLLSLTSLIVVFKRKKVN